MNLAPALRRIRAALEAAKAESGGLNAQLVRAREELARVKLLETHYQLTERGDAPWSWSHAIMFAPQYDGRALLRSYNGVRACGYCGHSRFTKDRRSVSTNSPRSRARRSRMMRAEAECLRDAPPSEDRHERKECVGRRRA